MTFFRILAYVLIAGFIGCAHKALPQSTPAIPAPDPGPGSRENAKLNPKESFPGQKGHEAYGQVQMPFGVKARLLPARVAFCMSGGKKRHHATSMQLAAATLSDTPFFAAIPGSIDYRLTPSALVHNEFTSQDMLAIAPANSIQGRNKWNAQRLWVNYLLGNFIYGQGPENLLFPLDSEISNALRNSSILRKAFADYPGSCTGHTRDRFVYRSEFTLADIPGVLLHPVSVCHFIGSADILITPLNDSLFKVTVFNITSVTSADIFRLFRKPDHWLPSFPRSSEVLPYANISQVFQFSCHINDVVIQAKNSRWKRKNNPGETGT